MYKVYNCSKFKILLIAAQFLIISSGLALDTLPNNVIDISSVAVQTNFQNGSVYFVAPQQKGILPLEINGEIDTFQIENGFSKWEVDLDRSGQLFILRNPESIGSLQLYHLSLSKEENVRIRQIPTWMSLLPPLLAIAAALIFKAVVIALLLGVLCGAFIASGMYFDSLLSGFLRTVDTYVIGALNDPYHLSIIVLALLIGAMVAIISNNGGMQGVINKIIPYAKTRRSTKLSAFFMGIVLFFDDYANTLIVGSTMKKLTDSFKISREKLAYIVDSTAAPIASVALVTTWVGAELTYIQSGIISMDIDLGNSIYGIFLASLKYSFYPFLTLFFVFFIIWSKRDFGPMFKAEKRALTVAKDPENDAPVGAAEGEDLEPKKGIPYRWYNGVIPIAVMLITAVVGLVHTGLVALFEEAVQTGISQGVFSWSAAWEAAPLLLEDSTSALQRVGLIIGYSDPYNSLLWAAGLAVVVALIMTFYQNLLSLTEGMLSFEKGIKSMIPAIIILVLAWALALVTRELGTANYLAGLMEGNINPYLLPPVIFVIAAFTAFSTGSSWSTMAILYPIALPMTYAVCVSSGLEPGITVEIILNVISIVLAASVLGDHCSPLSDTTILSSMASGCDHIEHVRTQMPYALTVGAFSLLAAFLSTFFGGGWFVSLNIVAVILVLFWLILLKFGKNAEGAGI